MTRELRRVAVIGGVRIPFCRSNTLYADLSNLEMMTAALNGLVDRFGLKGRHIDEVTRFPIDPDAEHAFLAARHHVCARPAHRDHDIVARRRCLRLAVALDRAEQHEFLAGIVRRHGHAVVRHRDDEFFGVRGRPCRGNDQEASEQQDRAVCHRPARSCPIENRSSGRITNSTAKRMPTDRISNPSSSRRCSPRMR